MITAIEDTFCLTFEDGRKIGQNRHASNAIMTLQTIELIGTAGRKSSANLSLMCTKHINGEMLRLHKRIEISGIKIDAPEYQRRIQRNRIETVDSDTGLVAALGHGGNNRNTGRETPERTSILDGIYFI